MNPGFLIPNKNRFVRFTSLINWGSWDSHQLNIRYSHIPSSQWDIHKVRSSACISILASHIFAHAGYPIGYLQSTCISCERLVIDECGSQSLRQAFHESVVKCRLWFDFCVQKHFHRTEGHRVLCLVYWPTVKQAFLGLRSVCQVISYEVRLAIIFFWLLSIHLSTANDGETIKKKLLYSENISKKL